MAEEQNIVDNDVPSGIDKKKTPLNALSSWYILGLFTPEQLIVMAIYPFTLFLGELVVLGSPEASYFSNKKNIFNIIFVKRGWFWTTVVYAFASWTCISTSQGNKATMIRQSLTRYVSATLWWIIFSQWLFGMPLMDRVFLWTGGSCGITANTTIAEPGFHRHLSSALCRTHGGEWIGGYDPSGHIFILTHGSLFLWFEILPLLNRLRPGAPLPLGLKVTLVFLTIWWWMFLMTSVYFHSLGEKVAGLFLGYIEVVAVYLVAERIPGIKLIFG